MSLNLPKDLYGVTTVEYLTLTMIEAPGLLTTST